MLIIWHGLTIFVLFIHELFQIAIFILISTQFSLQLFTHPFGVALTINYLATNHEFQCNGIHHQIE